MEYPGLVLPDRPVAGPQELALRADRVWFEAHSVFPLRSSMMQPCRIHFGQAALQTN
jgi:hypothetical protein